MVAQRGAGVAARKAAERQPETLGKTGSAGADKAPAPAKAKGKLSFKDKHALDTLPGVMADLEKRIAAARAKLDDPGLYERAPAEFTKRAETLPRCNKNCRTRRKNGFALKCSVRTLVLILISP